MALPPPSMDPTQKVILADGSSYRAGELHSWAVVATVVEASMHKTKVLHTVATSKGPESKDCSVVELLALLAATRLARWAKKKRAMPIEFVVTDRPAIFSNIEFVITGNGTPPRMPELKKTLDIFVTDFAMAARTRDEEVRIVLLDRREAVNRRLLGAHELKHEWAPHTLIEQHIYSGDKFSGNILRGLQNDEASLRSSSSEDRDACDWTCRTDRRSYLELICRRKTLLSRT